MGMFIVSFEGPWLDHPFWKTKFSIQDDEQLRLVRASGVPALWIDTERGPDLAAAKPPDDAVAGVAVEKIFEPAPARPAVPADRDEALRQAGEIKRRSTDLMRGLFGEARLGRAIEPSACAPIVEDVIVSVTQNSDALISIARLKTADEYTYAHSVAVCALMVSLGRQLGMEEQQLRQAGLVGMLHDLGKAAVPLEILNKPGRLTDEEYALIKLHAIRGYEMLRDADGMTEEILMAVRHHHERMDGAGYPDALPGESISMLARMAAVCDVYDALTSDRPYKAGWDPAHAIAQMATWRGHFDPRVFQCFVRSVGVYPTGSLVRMKSGLLGVVVEQNAGALTRPRIKLFYSTNAHVPIEPRIVDLSSGHCREEILGRENPENWKFEAIHELWAGEESAPLKRAGA